MHIAMGVDLGGTNIKAGVVDETGRVVVSTCAPTLSDRGPGAVIDRMAALIGELASSGAVAGAGLCGVGLATPGPLSPSRGVVIRSANLPGWADVPICKLITERTGLRTVLDNDANLAAYGEFRAGAEPPGVNPPARRCGSRPRRRAGPACRSCARCCAAAGHA
jgi:glucokinase